MNSQYAVGSERALDDGLYLVSNGHLTKKASTYEHANIMKDQLGKVFGGDWIIKHYNDVYELTYAR